jgi:hypothetical protein
MDSRPEFLLTEQQDAQEGRFEEKGKHSLHRQGLADNPAGKSGKPGPISAELKFHGYAGHHAKGKGQGKNLDPKSRCDIEMLILVQESAGFQKNNQERQADGELDEQIMEDNREGKLQTIVEERASHECPSRIRRALLRNVIQSGEGHTPGLSEKIMIRKPSSYLTRKKYRSVIRTLDEQFVTGGVLHQHVILSQRRRICTRIEEITAWRDTSFHQNDMASQDLLHS